jgi:hypothetical protein
LLGVTGPSAIQEGSASRERRARVIRLNVLYVTAFGAAAAMMTLIVFGVRQLLPSHTGIPPLVVGLLFVYLAACDMRLGPLRTPGLWRQTCPAWRLRFGIPLSTVFWGLDIGTTLSTIKMTSLYWASIIALIVASPPRPELAVACFAAGYLLAHLASGWRVARGVSVDAAVTWANAQAIRTRMTSGVVLAAIGVLVFSQGVVSWHG